MAYAAEKALRCASCGTAEWEWAESRHSYDAEHKFCLGCYKKQQLSQEREVLPGTSVVLVKLSLRQKAIRIVGEKRRARREREKQKAERDKADNLKGESAAS